VPAPAQSDAGPTFASLSIAANPSIDAPRGGCRSCAPGWGAAGDNPHSRASGRAAFRHRARDPGAHRKPLLKKTYPLHVEGKNPDRLLEATKHEIRKYIKREQNKPCPAGVDFWDFDCRFGSSPATAETIHLGALTERINAYAAEKADSFYVELIAKPGVRKPRPPTADHGADEHRED